MAVDPGERRIGLAVSDPMKMIARPLKTLRHRSRGEDAIQILKEAKAMGVEVIVVGVPYDQEGEVGPQARKSLRLVELLRDLGEIDIVTWDESGSTLMAQQHGEDELLDAKAAAVILQEFLNAKEE
jgi:putative Holliday junction resolvase